MVDLSSVRELRRREIAERRVRAVLEGNRAALSRLFATGLCLPSGSAMSDGDLDRVIDAVRSAISNAECARGVALSSLNLARA